MICLPITALCNAHRRKAWNFWTRGSVPARPLQSLQARLASETAFSTALLSKLETDRMVPTLQTLASLCRVYGIGLGYFFSEPNQRSLAITRKAHMAEGREQSTLKRIPLHVPTAEEKHVSGTFNLSAGVATPIGEFGERTEITAFVPEGALHLSLAGSQEVLEEGDCFVMNTDQTAIWSASPAGSCRVLCVSVK